MFGMIEIPAWLLICFIIMSVLQLQRGIIDISNLIEKWLNKNKRK